MCKLNIKNTITNEVRTINNAKAVGKDSVFCLYAGGKFRTCWHGVLSFSTDDKTNATAILLTPWVMCDESSSSAPSATTDPLAAYHWQKQQTPDVLLLFRKGDFYEAYEEDAETVADVLGISLTIAPKFKMAGFPYTEIDTYLPKLIRAGYRVAICDGEVTAKESTHTEPTKKQRVITPRATVKTVEEPAATPVQEPEPVQAETPSGDAISAAFAPLFAGVANTVKAQILAEIRPLIEQAAKSAKITTELEVKTVNGTHTANGVFHERFNDILQLIGNNIPVYLFGPAGTGKSYTAKQIAKALGLDFHYSTTVQNVYELTGFIDAGGVYHTTEFRTAFEQGGVFMIDELDASCPESLVCINTAIANRYFAFPDKPVTAHKDFRVIAAGNTVGTGANDEYTGRAVIDASTLNRFARIYFGYSESVEKSLTDDSDIIEFAHEIRRIKRAYNLTGVIFSYREIERLNAAKQLFPKDDTNALSVAFTGGLTDEVINTLSSYCELSGNRWAKALKETANKSKDWDF